MPWKVHDSSCSMREEGEGNYLRGYRKQFVTIETVSHGGPLTLVDGIVDDDDLRLASRIVARYSQGKNSNKVELEIRNLEGEKKNVEVTPAPPGEVRSEWIL